MYASVHASIYIPLSARVHSTSTLTMIVATGNDNNMWSTAAISV